MHKCYRSGKTAVSLKEIAMTLPSGHLKSKLIQKFSALGHYVREVQCEDIRFFFDFPAVCVNVKPAPEQQDFRGWWKEMEALASRFTYRYQFGLFDKEGSWRPAAIDDPEVSAKQEKAMREFHDRANALPATFSQKLEPVDVVSEPLRLRA
jgi:Transcriptional regulator Crl.